MLFNKNKNFCDINPLFYEISTCKGIAIRNIQDLLSPDRIAKLKSNDKLSNLVSEFNSVIIKTGKDIDPSTQEGKAVNIKLASSKISGIIIRPQETFSF